MDVRVRARVAVRVRVTVGIQDRLGLQLRSRLGSRASLDSVKEVAVDGSRLGPGSSSRQFRGRYVCSDFRHMETAEEWHCSVVEASCPCPHPSPSSLIVTLGVGGYGYGQS